MQPGGESGSGANDDNVTSGRHGEELGMASPTLGTASAGADIAIAQTEAPCHQGSQPASAAPALQPTIRIAAADAHSEHPATAPASHASGPLTCESCLHLSDQLNYCGGRCARKLCRWCLFRQFRSRPVCIREYVRALHPREVDIQEARRLVRAWVAPELKANLSGPEGGGSSTSSGGTTSSRGIDPNATRDCD